MLLHARQEHEVVGGVQHRLAVGALLAVGHAGDDLHAAHDGQLGLGDAVQEAVLADVLRRAVPLVLRLPPVRALSVEVLAQRGLAPAVVAVGAAVDAVHVAVRLGADGAQARALRALAHAHRLDGVGVAHGLVGLDLPRARVAVRRVLHAGQHAALRHVLGERELIGLALDHVGAPRGAHGQVVGSGGQRGLAVPEGLLLVELRVEGQGVVPLQDDAGQLLAVLQLQLGGEVAHVVGHVVGGAAVRVGPLGGDLVADAEHVGCQAVAAHARQAVPVRLQRRNLVVRHRLQRARDGAARVVGDDGVFHDGVLCCHVTPSFSRPRTAGPCR